MSAFPREASWDVIGYMSFLSGQLSVNFPSKNIDRNQRKFMNDYIKTRDPSDEKITNTGNYRGGLSWGGLG